MPEGKERRGGFSKADGILLSQILVFDSRGFKMLLLNSKRGEKCFTFCKTKVDLLGGNNCLQDVSYLHQAPKCPFRQSDEATLTYLFI